MQCSTVLVLLITVKAALLLLKLPNRQSLRAEATRTDQVLCIYQRQIKGLKKNYLKLREEIKDDKKKFTEVYEKIKQDAKKFTIDQNGIQVIEGDEFYKGLKEHYYQFLKFADNQIDIQIDLLNVLRSLTDKKKNQNIDIRKDISNLSKSISKYILIAFFLQLIIFIIVQLFEVYTTKKEIDEKR